MNRLAFILSVLVCLVSGWAVADRWRAGHPPENVPIPGNPTLNVGAVLCHYPSREAWIYMPTTADIPRLVRNRALDPTCESNPANR